MLKVNLTPSRTLGISWSHPVEGKGKKARRSTYCMIYELDTNGKAAPTFLACERAKCFTGSRARWDESAQTFQPSIPPDTFNKEVGRRRSLTAALKVLSESNLLSRGDRTLVWTAYFDRFPKEKKEAEPEPLLNLDIVATSHSTGLPATS